MINIHKMGCCILVFKLFQSRNCARAAMTYLASLCHGISTQRKRYYGEALFLCSLKLQQDAQLEDVAEF